MARVQRAESSSVGPGPGEDRGAEPGEIPGGRGPALQGAAPLRYAIAAITLALATLVALTAGPLVAHPRDFSSSPPPDIPATEVPEIPPPAAGGGSGGGMDATVLWVLAVTLSLLLLVALVRYLLRVLRQPGRITAPPLGPAWRTLTPHTVGLGENEAEVDQQQDRSFDAQRSADDIIATWTAVEKAADLLGRGRRPSETPTEFLAVCMAAWGEASPGVSEVLLGLYHRARFDTAALSVGAASAARSAGRQLIATWTAGARDGARPDRADGVGFAAEDRP